MARKKPTDGEESAAPSDTISFEEALSSLEAIVAAMEEEQLPLEELVASYEKGSKLLEHCETVLSSARKRLQTISERQTGGNSRQTPDSLDGEQEMPDDAPAPAAATDDDDDDDIRLF